MDRKKALKLKSMSRATGIDAISKLPFVRALEGDNNLRRPTTRQTESETADEYRRIQNIAAKGDKRLNKALASALCAVLPAEDGYSVSAELKLEDGRLKPDIVVTRPGSELTCLEVTWRTTGSPVGGKSRSARILYQSGIYRSTCSRR